MDDDEGIKPWELERIRRSLVLGGSLPKDEAERLLAEVWRLRGLLAPETAAEPRGPER